MNSNIKKINECKKLSKEFWHCIDNNKNKSSVKLHCGKEFYILSQCMKKIN